MPLIINKPYKLHHTLSLAETYSQCLLSQSHLSCTPHPPRTVFLFHSFSRNLELVMSELVGRLIRFIANTRAVSVHKINIRENTQKVYIISGKSTFKMLNHCFIGTLVYQYKSQRSNPRHRRSLP